MVAMLVGDAGTVDVELDVDAVTCERRGEGRWVLEEFVSGNDRRCEGVLLVMDSFRFVNSSRGQLAYRRFDQKISMVDNKKSAKVEENVPR